MTHLSEEQIYQTIFDRTSLSKAAVDHIVTCDACQEKVRQLQMFYQELTVAERSQPAPSVLAAYYQLFDQVQSEPSALRRGIAWLRAQLRWDSRQQPALQGVRGAGSPTYRLLYSSEVADVDLLVEARNGSRRIEGEIVPLETSELQLPALLQVSNLLNSESVYEVESDSEGRFRIESLMPGTYSFALMPRQGANLQIDELRLT